MSPPTRSRVSRWVFVGALGVVFAAWFAGLVGAYVGTKLAERDDPVPRRPSTLGLAVASPRTDPLPAMDVPSAAGVIGPSVVAVQVDVDGQGTSGVSFGSGVVLTADGDILTNAHVVHDATTANVRLVGESEPRPAAVLAVDHGNDLALLHVDATGLVPATFAEPGAVRLGDQVLAVGFALDLDGDPTVTLGIVSALDRSLSTAEGALDGLLQTDASISSGNSGGPLVNSLGQVVGINTLVAVSQAGTAANSVGFAISTAELLPDIVALRGLARGEVVHEAYMGVKLVSRVDGGSGALVQAVESGSPADDAGIEAGDVVVAVDGDRVDGSAALVAVIRQHQPGSQVQLSVVHDGTPREVTVVLATRPGT